MAETVLGCDNDKCIAHKECERYRLFKAGQKEYKTHGGKLQT